MKYKNFIFHCQGTELRVKQYTTKHKICLSSSINFKYDKKKIQIFGVNMTVISLTELKKCIYFMTGSSSLMKYTFLHFMWWNKSHIHSKNLNILHRCEVEEK